MNSKLERLYDMAVNDLTRNLMPWWMEKAVDEANGGFYGEIDCDDRPVPDAPKFITLNARLVWTFASVYRVLGDEKYREMADRAYRYLVEHFRDERHGGYYAMVDGKGRVLDDHKFVYGNAFALYGLSEYARATGSEEALALAKEQAASLEKAWDPQYKGFYETAKRDWSPSPWIRGVNRSPEDVKTMNSHLHLLEAYACHLRVNRSPFMQNRVRQLLYIMLNRIVDGDIHHYRCFMDRAWNPTSWEISYGHDIEGSWLMLEAAQVLGEAEALRRTRDVCVNMARAALEEGFTGEGAMLTDFDPVSGRRSQSLSWWEQNEAVVGFLNAWEQTGDERFLDASVRCFEYIEGHFIDRANGGWYPYLTLDGASQNRSKADGWTCPYHNSRMSLEIIERCRPRLISDAP
ncbi:MAG: AGE family epimerase/isomerase [Clostridia bacterium]|nr:AGE family epimerase/isomerase [Clostridia bacterium]